MRKIVTPDAQVDERERAFADRARVLGERPWATPRSGYEQRRGLPAQVAAQAEAKERPPGVETDQTTTVRRRPGAGLPTGGFKCVPADEQRRRRRAAVSRAWGGGSAGVSRHHILFLCDIVVFGLSSARWRGVSPCDVRSRGFCELKNGFFAE